MPISMPTAHQAYSLTSDFSDIEAATIAAPDGRTINLVDLLHGDEAAGAGPAGTIVTSDEYLKYALDEHVAFKRTGTPDDWQPATGRDNEPLEPRELADLSKADLVARADAANIDSSGTKAAILHRLAPDHFADPSGVEPGPTHLDPDGTPVAETQET